MRSRTTLTGELRAAGVDWRLNVYGGAEHAFHHPPTNLDGTPAPGRAHTQTVLPSVAYHPAHAPRAWRAVLDLLAETFGTPAGAPEWPGDTWSALAAGRRAPGMISPPRQRVGPPAPDTGRAGSR